MLHSEAQRHRLDYFTAKNTEKVREEGKVQQHKWTTGEGTKILFLSLTVHYHIVSTSVLRVPK